MVTNLGNIKKDGIRFDPSESPLPIKARPIFGENGELEYSRLNTETNTVISGFRIYEDSSNEETSYGLSILGEEPNKFEFLSEKAVVYIGDGGGIKIWCDAFWEISDDGSPGSISFKCRSSLLVSPDGTFEIDEIRLKPCLLYTSDAADE